MLEIAAPRTGSGIRLEVATARRARREILDGRLQ
jgi:hypothetical protein